MATGFFFFLDEYPGIFSAKNKASLKYLVRRRFKEVLKEVLCQSTLEDVQV